MGKIFQDLKIGTFFLMDSPREKGEKLGEWEAETSALHKKVRDGAVRITDGVYYAVSPGQPVRIVRI